MRDTDLRDWSGKLGLSELNHFRAVLWKRCQGSSWRQVAWTDLQLQMMLWPVLQQKPTLSVSWTFSTLTPVLTMLIRSYGKQARTVGWTKTDPKQWSNPGKIKQRGRCDRQCWGEKSLRRITIHTSESIWIKWIQVTTLWNAMSMSSERPPVKQPAGDPLHLQLHPTDQASGWCWQEGRASERWGESWYEKPKYWRPPRLMARISSFYCRWWWRAEGSKDASLWRKPIRKGVKTFELISHNHKPGLKDLLRWRLYLALRPLILPDKSWRSVICWYPSDSQFQLQEKMM